MKMQLVYFIQAARKDIISDNSVAYAATNSPCGTVSGTLMNSMSISTLISSLTSQPPVSRATFQFKPQSLRLILAVALNPALCDQGAFASPRNSTSKRQGA